MDGETDEHAAQLQDGLLMADGGEACGAHHEAVRNVCDRTRRARRRRRWLLLLLLLRAQRVALLRPDGVRRARRRCVCTIVLILG
jgi:hypothetical protein